MKNEIVLGSRVQPIEAREKPLSLEQQAILKLFKVPPANSGIWSSEIWGEFRIEHFKLENRDNVFNVLLLTNEARIEISVDEEPQEGKWRKWFKNIGRTQGGFTVNNTTFWDLFIQERNLDGDMIRLLRPEEEDNFFRELITANVVPVLEPESYEEVVWKPGMDLKVTKS